jgi:serine/threonine protein kinase
LVLGLTASFDRLTEAELDEILGAPVTESLEFASSENPSPAPPYAVHSVNLALLPAAYLSSKLCIIDFDQAFLITEPRRELSRIPTLYLAPESIFTLTNGPAADIWALGCLLFSLRTSWSLFQDLMTCTPRSTVLRMYQVLGSLPQQWKSFPFHLGYPVHEPLQPGVEYKTFEWLDDHSGGDLQELVEDILEPLRPQTTQGRDDGIGKFCLPVPSFSRSYTRARFEAEQLTPIKKEDALLFTDLLRQIFTYDHQKRITARQILEHHWLREPGQRPRHAPPGSGVHKLPFRTNHSKTSTRMAPAQPPGHSPATARTTSEKRSAPCRGRRRRRRR